MTDFKSEAWQYGGYDIQPQHVLITGRVNDESVIVARCPVINNQGQETLQRAKVFIASAEVLEALKAILPYAENEIASLQDLGRDDADTMEEYETASNILQSVYEAIKKAEGK